MSRSFMIHFMVSVIHGLKQKFAFHFDLFLYCFYTLVKSKFFDNGVNFVFP